MTEPDPIQKLEYAKPGMPRRPLNIGHFSLGLIVGSIASGLIWFLGWNSLVNHGSGIALVIVPATKVVIAIPLMLKRPWRSCGIGLLLSIPIGGLLFFGSCFANFRYH